MVIHLKKYQEKQKFNNLYAKVVSEASYHIAQCNDFFCEFTCNVSLDAEDDNYKLAITALKIMDKALNADPENIMYEYASQCLLTGHPRLFTDDYQLDFGEVHSFCAITSSIATLDEYVKSDDDECWGITVPALDEYQGDDYGTNFFKNNIVKNINHGFNKIFQKLGILSRGLHETKTGYKIERLGVIPLFNDAGFHHSLCKFDWEYLFNNSENGDKYFGIDFVMNLYELYKKHYKSINNHIFFVVMLYSLLRLLNYGNSQDIIENLTWFLHDIRKINNQVVDKKFKREYDKKYGLPKDLKQRVDLVNLTKIQIKGLPKNNN